MTESDATQWLPPNHPIVSPERLAKGDLRFEEAPEGKIDRGGIEIRSYGEPLFHYALKGIITEVQRQAGERLFVLHHASWAARFKTMQFGHHPKATDLEVSKKLALDYLAAIDAVRGQMQKRVAYSVCCYGEYVGNLVASSKRTAERRGIVLLRCALDDLAKHFGL